MKLSILNTFSQIALALPAVLLITFGVVLATKITRREPIMHIIAIGIGAIVMSCGICIGITNSRDNVWDNMVMTGYDVYYGEQIVNPEAVPSLNLHNICVDNDSKTIHLSPVSWNHNNIDMLLAVDEP